MGHEPKTQIKVDSCHGCAFVQDGFNGPLCGPLCGLRHHLALYHGTGEVPEDYTADIPHEMYQAKTFASPDWCPLRAGSVTFFMGVDGFQMRTTHYTEEETRAIDEQNERDYQARQRDIDEDE